MFQNHRNISLKYQIHYPIQALDWIQSLVLLVARTAPKATATASDIVSAVVSEFATMMFLYQEIIS